MEVYERFLEEGLGECLHLKFMQIETAFQESQLQMLKINDNFMKIQAALGEDIGKLYTFNNSMSFRP